MQKCLLLIGILVAVSAVAMATTITVPFEQPTIQAGIDAASDGDTVLVSPGTYTENIDFSGKRIVVTVSDALSPTMIQPADPNIATVKFVQNEPVGAELSGFILTGSTSSAVLCDSASAIIRNNEFVGNNSTTAFQGSAIFVKYHLSPALIAHNTFHDNICSDHFGGMIHFMSNTQGDTISYNVFYDNGGGNVAIITQIDGVQISVHNNTIDVGGPGWGLYNRGSSAYVDCRNNIIFGGEYGAIASDDSWGVIAEYNCTFNNEYDYLTITPGPGNIYDNADFVDTANHDYHLSAGSPCIDAGDPDPTYNDADGTRNDMGAFPRLLGNLPFARINFGSANFKHIIDPTPDIYWEYYDTLAGQAAYHIQVGTDDEWSVAEMWDTGPVSSSATSATYAGAPLLDGSTYYVRLGVNNGFSWGDWDVFKFRMNSIPTVPTPVRPINQAEVPTLVRLTVDNSSDAEGDSLWYDFEVYEDAGLSILFDAQTGVAEQAGQTMSEPFSGFTLDTEYWWRGRASDGYESSGWSDTGSFITRDSCSVQLPGDADNDGDIDQDDADYLYAYLCEDGPAPVVPANGDADGDCDIDNLDVYYIEAYLDTGPPPVTCTCIEPAFTGCFQPCDCRPGEANNDWAFGIGDVVYVINYVFKHGPAPMPYETCSGDFTGDCSCNIADAVAGINYIFHGGPPPPSCDQWRINCGWPLYKGD